jgi:hypothetical protein
MENQCIFFRKGFASVIELEMLRMFNHKELQLFISGTP